MRKYFRFSIVASLFAFVSAGEANATDISEFQFTPSQWAGTCGTVDNSTSIIKATAYQYGCAGIKNSTPFKIAKRQTYLVVRGTKLVSGTNNPCLYNFNDSNLASKPLFTCSGDSVLYMDITSYISSLTTDFIGRCTINSIGIYIQKTSDDSEADITSISLEPVDWLAVSTPVITQNNTECTPTFVDGNTITTKTLTFTPNTKNAEFNIKLTPSINMNFNNSDAYLVIESSTNITDKTRKLAGLTIGGTKFGSTSYNTNSTKTTLSNGHFLQILSPSSSIANLFTLYQSQSDLSATNMEMYLYNDSITTASIYRIGLYNYGEICNLYPELKYYNWRLVSPSSTRIETYNGGKRSDMSTSFTISRVDTLSSINLANTVIRSLGALPSNITSISLNNMRFRSGLTANTEDIYSSWTSNPTILLDQTAFKYFPTINPNINVQGSYYYAYKDGTAPSSVTATYDGARSTTYSSFTRELKAGYNSCILPFDISTSNLPSELSAYEYTSYESGKATFTLQPTATTIAAGTPFIIKASAAGLYCIPASGAPSITSPVSYYNTSSDFIGSFVNEQPMATGKDYAGKYCYGLKTDGSAFAPMTASNYTTYYRAFLKFDTDPFSGSAKEIEASFVDDTPTGISEVTTSSDKVNVYNISGMMVKRNVNLNSSLEGLSHGIYIINGKKVIK